MHGCANPLLPRDLAERAISQSLITISSFKPDPTSPTYVGAAAKR
jgi:hypothetical protein